MEPLLITAYHAKYFAHELSRRHSSTDSEKLAGTRLDQVEAQLQQQMVSTVLFTVRWAVT